jgi:dolichyl-phosphate beta-glucosyltransferase
MVVELSVIIPTFNVEEDIRKNLISLKRFLDKKFRYEIVVVDDGSRDRTPKILKDLAREHKTIRFVKLKENRGKGYALRRGFSSAKGEYIFFIDGDFQHDYHAIPKILPLFKDYDMLIGSREERGSSIKDIRYFPTTRFILGRLYSLLCLALLRIPFKDVQCGFKGFKRSVIKGMRLERDRYEIDAEILKKAISKGYKIKPFPVNVSYFPESTVDSFRDSFAMFFGVLKIWWVNR